MVFIETPIFTRLIRQLVNDEEYKAIQELLIIRPNAGTLIQRSGGIRKLRWKLEKKGKSGGLRILYYWHVAEDQIFMLYVFPKSEYENLTDTQLAQLRKVVEQW